jgi:hypothetical protein
MLKIFNTFFGSPSHFVTNRCDAFSKTSLLVLRCNKSISFNILFRFSFGSTSCCAFFCTQQNLLQGEKFLKCRLFAYTTNSRSSNFPTRHPPLCTTCQNVRVNHITPDLFFSGGGEIHYVQPPGRQVALDSMGLLAVMVGASLPTKTPPHIHTQAPGTARALLRVLSVQCL